MYWQRLPKLKCTAFSRAATASEISPLTSMPGGPKTNSKTREFSARSSAKVLGCLSSRQLRTLAHIARVYDKGFGHFTTRQNLQFNWVKLEDIPDVLAALAEVEMHCIQSSGNCIRNITSDQYAGRARDELEDPRVFCEIIRQWYTLHPEFAYLPRKLAGRTVPSAGCSAPEW